MSKILTREGLIDFLEPLIMQHYDSEGIKKIKDAIESVKIGMDDGGRTLDILYSYEWAADIVYKYCPLQIEGIRVCHMFRSL